MLLRCNASMLTIVAILTDRKNCLAGYRSTQNVRSRRLQRSTFAANGACRD